jgi:hypothetical protein
LALLKCFQKFVHAGDVVSSSFIVFLFDQFSFHQVNAQDEKDGCDGGDPDEAYEQR